MIDCNAFIGNWAFRRLRNNDAAGVLGMMDQFGIERACVASADAILYKNAQAGNEKLRDETQERDDRFWLYATVNPAFPGWERDLRDCVDMGFRAIRLYPYYHDYSLPGPEAAALLDAAAETGLPVSIPGRVVDVRQRHWMDVTENLAPADILDVAEKHPGTTVLLTECILGWAPESDEWKRAKALPFYIEMSRMTSVLGKNIQVAARALGAERVLLGTGYPFKAPSPAFLKIDALDAADADKQAIVRGNAEQLFAPGE